MASQGAERGVCPATTAQSDPSSAKPIMPELSDGATASSEGIDSDRNSLPINTALLPAGFVNVFESLTSVSRPLLIRLVERFLNDPSFRDSIKYFLDPYDQEPEEETPFRYMDLPTELRVKIAKYALHHDGGLNWYWKLKKNGDPETYVGSFRLSNKSESINPLGETCTQLYEETSAIPFKVNILIFGPYFMNRRVDPLEGWRATFDAYNHFFDEVASKYIGGIEVRAFRLPFRPTSPEDDLGERNFRSGQEVSLPKSARE